MKPGLWSAIVQVAEALCALCILVLGAIVMYEVVSRYVFDAPTIWVQEIAVYLLIAVTFLGLAPTQHAGEHIRIDVVSKRFSAAARRRLEIVTLLSIAALAAVAAWGGWQMVEQSLRFGRRSPTLLAVPVWIPQLLLPFGMALLALGALVARMEAPAQQRQRRVLSFALVVVVLCVLLALAFPVGIALCIAGAIGLVATGQSLDIVGEVLYSAVDNFVLLSIPLFVLMSRLLMKTGLGDEIFELINAFLRHLPGGLAAGAVLCCAFFAAISGSSVTNAAAVGLVAIPSLVRHGYPKPFAAGLIAAGGTLGILIPPSIPFIVYGAIADQSVSKLFLAGVVPGAHRDRPDPRLCSRDLAHARLRHARAAAALERPHARTGPRGAAARPAGAHPGRDLHRGVHADRGGRCGRGAHDRARGRRLSPPDARRGLGRRARDRARERDDHPDRGRREALRARQHHDADSAGLRAMADRGGHRPGRRSLPSPCWC